MTDRHIDVKHMAELLPWIARRLAEMTSVNIDAAFVAAGDELDDAGETWPSAVLDAMRAGIDQVRQANAGSRVVVIWSDDWGARDTFSWPAGHDADPEFAETVKLAVAHALRADGAGSEPDRSPIGADDAPSWDEPA